MFLAILSKCFFHPYFRMAFFVLDLKNIFCRPPKIQSHPKGLILTASSSPTHHAPSIPPYPSHPNVCAYLFRRHSKLAKRPTIPLPPPPISSISNPMPSGHLRGLRIIGLVRGEFPENYPKFCLIPRKNLRRKRQKCILLGPNTFWP